MCLDLGKPRPAPTKRWSLKIGLPKLREIKESVSLVWAIREACQSCMGKQCAWIWETPKAVPETSAHQREGKPGEQNPNEETDADDRGARDVVDAVV